MCVGCEGRRAFCTQTGSAGSAGIGSGGGGGQAGCWQGSRAEDRLGSGLREATLTRVCRRAGRAAGDCTRVGHLFGMLERLGMLGLQLGAGERVDGRRVLLIVAGLRAGLRAGWGGQAGLRAGWRGSGGTLAG